MRLVEEGKVKAVIYNEDYRGLEAVPRALRALEAHKAWGRAVLRINEEAENEVKAKL